MCSSDLVAPKHRIKQVDRFLSNGGIHADDCCEDLTRMVIGPRKSIRIAIDWTAVGPWDVLVASMVIQRRGQPLYWAACDHNHFTRSQNAIEDAFLTRLRLMIPRDVEVTLLFDRGFRRVSLVQHLRKLGFHFVIRAMDDILVVGDDYRGYLRDLPLPRTKVRDQKEASHLFTDLDLPARDVVKLYAQRFTIEEVFRDEKSTRYGWSLTEYRLKSRLDRLDRLLLVLAATYFLVSIIGHHIHAKGLDRLYKANTVRTRTHSAFQMGWKAHRLVRWLPAVWLRRFQELPFDLAMTPACEDEP